MLLFNVVVFVMVTVVLVKHTRKKLTKDSSKKKEVTQGTIKAIISIFSVMLMFGLSWLFGALSISDGAIFFQWPFVIFNTLQGFFLFIFFCVIGNDARDEWINLLTCYRRKKKQKYSTTPSHASHAPRSTKQTDLTSRFGQSRTIRRSVGLEPEHSELDSSVYDKRVLSHEMSSYGDHNLKSIIEETNLVITNGSAAVVEESKVDLSSKPIPDKPRRKKASSQLPPHIQFKLKRPYYQVVIDQEESIPTSSPVEFSQDLTQDLTQTSDCMVFSNLTDDGTMELIDHDDQDIKYSVV